MATKDGRSLIRHCGARSLRVETLESRRMLSATASDAINLFAADVYSHMQREEGNLFFSPLSLHAGLAMTSVGAAGQTAAEMQQVLHLGTDPAIHDSYRDLLTSMLIRSFTVSDFQLIASNAIWPQSGLAVDPDFVDAIETQYRGHVEGVDFANPQQAEDTINEWVAQQTQGNIDDLVKDLSPQTVMVLTNTVYFNSLWDSPFDPEETYNDLFYRGPDDTIAVPTMHHQAEVSRTQINGYDVLELPFVNGQSSMVLAMPLESGSSSTLTTEVLLGIDTWLESPRTTNLMQLSLPRFETTVESNVNQLLIDLGMPTAFDHGAADFTEIFANPGVAIEKVAHKATIEVNEQGTEAAAATEVELFLCFAAGTPVLTPDGTRSIEALHEGDTVLSRDEHNVDAELQPKLIEETRQGEAAVVKLVVQGKSLKATELHPFYVKGHGWTPAGKLKQGDQLATCGSDWAEVDSIEKTSEVVPVFNLRVADHHTYFVGGDDDRPAIWTHNFYGDGFYADQPFHFMIRDNVLDTIAFMGRIDDPTQISNTVSPVVATTVGLPGDYDGSGFVDEADKAVWRAAYGQIGSGLAADGNADGRVDAADYSIWRDNLGMSATASLSQEVAEPDTESVEGIAASTGRESLPIGREFRPSSRGSFAQTATDDSLLLLLARATASSSARESLASDDATSSEKTEATTRDRGFERIGREISPAIRSGWR